MNEATEMQPTFTSVDQEHLRKFHDVMKMALEHIESDLVDWCEYENMETIRAKTWLNKLTADIGSLKDAIELVRKDLGFVDTGDDT